jgi:hypothetical protein
MVGGRRITDRQPALAPRRGTASPARLWELPDQTRSWIVVHRDHVIAGVSRDTQHLRLEVFDSESAARRRSEEWRLEFAGVFRADG